MIDSFRGLSLIHRKLFVSGNYSNIIFTLFLDNKNLYSIKILFAGHIVVNDQESHEIYSEHRNLIKGVSRVGEIEVQFSNSYKKTANTIYNKTGSDVYLYMLLKVKSIVHCKILNCLLQRFNHFYFFRTLRQWKRSNLMF